MGAPKPSRVARSNSIVGADTATTPREYAAGIARRALGSEQGGMVLRPCCERSRLATSHPPHRISGFSDDLASQQREEMVEVRDEPVGEPRVNEVLPGHLVRNVDELYRSAGGD